MYRKYLTLILTVLVINLSLSATIFAETKAEKEAKFAEKIKINVTKLGIGTDAKVQVKLKDGTKLNGYISQINEDSFLVVDEKTGETKEVPYPQTKQIKGNNLSTGVKIAIGVAIGLAIIVIIAYAIAPKAAQ
ncbi:MAG TPA: hypothetical protein PKY82_00460 [Pyrinomonadaceae bacterium]|nr:hypothetical protein [Pyrinomonadaceae bacterium]